MDNLTHSLVGLTVAKAGLERLSPAGTAVCILAANAPDSDVVVGLFADRWTLLHHHRGITHSIVGTICLALVLPILVYAIDKLFAYCRRRAPTVRLRGLLVVSLVVTATHPFLDWLNNYGVRPLLPFDSRWFYGDVLYIVDPFMWLFLGGASFLMTSRTRVQKFFWIAIALILTWLVAFGPGRRADLSNPNVLVAVWFGTLLILVVLFVIKAHERWGARVAVVGLALVLSYWIGLSFAHRRALSLTTDVANVIASQYQESVKRLAVMPTLADPFRWDSTFETNGATYRFRLGILEKDRTPGRLVRYPKPEGELAAAIQQISEDRRLKIFLDFARFPVARLRDPACTTETLVQFADLRYTEPGRQRATFTIDLPVDCRSLRTSR
ncbi:MAG TPA: metal-dependent hydrolase [Pyrinomonadaceae bacterium]|nr:metal-dependent hydrolase [Pyrinomonadaceae bacterium]